MVEAIIDFVLLFILMHEILYLCVLLENSYTTEENLNTAFKCEFRL